MQNLENSNAENAQSFTTTVYQKTNELSTLLFSGKKGSEKMKLNNMSESDEENLLNPEIDNDDDEKLTLTPAEASKSLGIGITKMYALIHSDDFPTIKIGSHYIIPKSALKLWLENQIQKN